MIDREAPAFIDRRPASRSAPGAPGAGRRVAGPDQPSRKQASEHQEERRGVRERAGKFGTPLTNRGSLILEGLRSFSG
jgi:hypothetical protein